MKLVFIKFIPFVILSKNNYVFFERSQSTVLWGGHLEISPVSGQTSCPSVGMLPHSISNIKSAFDVPLTYQ